MIFVVVQSYKILYKLVYYPLIFSILNFIRFKRQHVALGLRLTINMIIVGSIPTTQCNELVRIVKDLNFKFLHIQFVV